MQSPLTGRPHASLPTRRSPGLGAARPGRGPCGLCPQRPICFELGIGANLRAGKEEAPREGCLRRPRLSAASAHRPEPARRFSLLTDAHSAQTARGPPPPARSPQPPSPGGAPASARCTRSGCPGRSGPWPAPRRPPARATASGLCRGSKSASGRSRGARHLRLRTRPSLWRRLHPRRLRRDQRGPEVSPVRAFFFLSSLDD